LVCTVPLATAISHLRFDCALFGIYMPPINDESDS
jgi:hypothetical protein